MGIIKHRELRSRLEASIRSGEFGAGGQLPTEQQIAADFGVSYMTARRAVSELVAAELVERRSRKGTFVRAHSGNQLAKPPLNLITASYEGTFARDFLSLGMLIAQRHGFSPNCIRLAKDQQDPAVRVIRDGEAAILLLNKFSLESALGLAVCAAGRRVVCLDQDHSSFGVPFVSSDYKLEVQLPLQYFRRMGHRKLAVVIQVPAGNTNLLDYDWTSSIGNVCGLLDLDWQTIGVRTQTWQSPMRDAYEAMNEFLSRDTETTAILSYGAEMTIGILAACKEAGRPVPDSLSIINMGEANLMEFASTPVTCIDFRQEAKIEAAIGIIEASLTGETDGVLRVAIPPVLLERQSVGRCAEMRI